MGARRTKEKTDRESKRSKARRAEELRALFDQQDNAEQVPNATSQSNVDGHAKTNNASMTVRTPTPTPTELTNSRQAAIAQPLDVTLTKTPSRVYERPREATSLRTVIAPHPYSPAKRIDRTEKIPARAESEEKVSSWWLGPVLITAALLMLSIGWWNIERSAALRASGRMKTVPTAQNAEAQKKAHQERVDFYRYQLGHRLNQSRVQTEIQNLNQAPALSIAERPIVDRSMLRGAPIMPEGYGAGSYRDRTTPVSPDHPDARIQYGLQEEQERDGFSQIADKAFVEDFVANAESEGYKVILDSDMNVVDVQPIRGFDAKSRKPGSYDFNGVQAR